MKGSGLPLFASFVFLTTTIMTMVRPFMAFHIRSTTKPGVPLSLWTNNHNINNHKQPHARWFLHRLGMSSSSNDNNNNSDILKQGVSRIETLQSLLALCGAPGSVGCQEPMVPIVDADARYEKDLHPLLVPIAKSETTGHFVCALRRTSTGETTADTTTSTTPLPLVEGGVGLPGMRLLSLHSEQYMRRMAAEADAADAANQHDVLNLYNDGLGTMDTQLSEADAELDNPYEPGAVAKLGYGPDKYTLLRVGPFPDLYETMANQHAGRGDESSSLIAAEASNGKFAGFGSTFAFYAQLLASFPNRRDEARDAARVCLRLPLSSVALTATGLAEVSRYACLTTSSATMEDNEDSLEVALRELDAFYEKVKAHEKEQEGSATAGGANDSGKTAEQLALDEANYLMDKTSLSCGKTEDGRVAWSSIRKELGDIYAKAGQDDMAVFVDPSR